MCSETLNKTSIDEIWMTPCGWRKDKQLKTDPQTRLSMVETSIEDYFPRGFPVKSCDVEVNNGESIPTFFLIEQLEK